MGLWPNHASFSLQGVQSASPWKLSAILSSTYLLLQSVFYSNWQQKSHTEGTQGSTRVLLLLSLGDSKEQWENLLSSTETPWKFRKPSGTCLFKHITALTKENMTALIKIIKNLVQITKFLNPASVSSRTVAAPSLPYLQMSNQLLTQVLVQVDDRNNVENHSAFHVAELVQGHCGHLKVHWPVGFTRK